MIRTRFAPSPTGYLHIGGLRTALYSFLFAKRNDGKFILRIEDTDRQRLVEDACQIIYKTLKQSGIVYDEGPDVGGGYGPYIQSERKEIYLQYAKQLVEEGGAYYCFCDKGRLDELHKKGHTKYDKHCLSLSKQEVLQRLERNESYVIRQNIPQNGTSVYTDLVFGEIAVDNKELEDNVLIKSDGFATYNFANVVDDHLMDITYCIRGVEYLSSTPKYNMLYDAFGWERPKYIHLQPIMRDERHKLSKRDGDASFDDFIKKGFLTEAIVNYIALLGWSPKNDLEKMSLNKMIELFDVNGISKSPSFFDEAKMRWLNSLYMKELDLDDFHKMAMPFYEQFGLNKEPLDLQYLSHLLHERVDIFSAIKDWTHFIFEFDNYNLDNLINLKWKTDLELAKKILPELIEITQSGYEKVEELLPEFAINAGLKKGQVLWIYRVALTGAQSTPGGAGEMARLFSKAEVLRRLNVTLQRLG